MGIRYLTLTLLNIVLGIIAFFLGLRIVLRLFAANPSTPFVAWIYGVSETLIAPFRGIFPSTTIVPGSVFDIPAFVALLAYGLLFFVISSVLNMIFNALVLRDDRVAHDEHVHSHA